MATTSNKPERSFEPYYDNIEKAVEDNHLYRNVVYTDENIQIVLMTLKPKVRIGMESHPGTTQFFRIEKGVGLAIIEGKGYILNDGVALTVLPGMMHDIINTSDHNLHLYTIYSPPQHRHLTRQVNAPK